MDLSLEIKGEFELKEIPDLEETKKKLEESGFYVQKVTPFEGRRPGLMVIGGNTLDEMISFAKKAEIGIIFMDAWYLEKEAYKIEIDLGDDQDFIEGDIKEYNEMLDSLNFNRPYDMVLYCHYGSQNYGIIFQNQELYEIASVSKMERMRMFRENHQQEMETMIAERQKRYDYSEDALVQALVGEEEFKTCTNQASRRDYLEKYLRRNKDSKEVKDFYETHRYAAPATMKNIGDRAWAIVKKK